VTRHATVVLLVALLGVSACAGHAGHSARSSQQGTLTSAELVYGRAPVPGGGITYRPDVVLVGGGAAMVRSVSGDSLTWSIDARAPHLGDLRPGKVMFLTGRAVGRVLKLERRGDVVAVTLGPVDLTDVISDGDINISAPLDVAAMTFQTYPDVPGLVDVSSTGTSKTVSKRVMPRWATRGAGAQAVSFGGPLHTDEPLPPPSTGSSVELSVGDFSAELGRKVTGEENELSLKLGYKERGVVLGLEFAVKLENPTIEGNLGFHDGVLGKRELQVNGLKEVSVKLESGSETGLSGNFKSRIEVPAEITVPLPAGAIPFVASFRFKFIVETAFSARNATLSATGKLKVDGPIGFTGAKLLLPTVTSAQSPVDNLSGVSVGVNGVVIAEQVKVVIGLGIPAAFTGPFAALTLSYGLTNGSAIGIVQCRQASIDVVLAGGVGFTIAPAESTALKDLLEKFPWKPKLDSEFGSVTTSVIHDVTYLPKVPVCRP
jgi:hypothetical protein